MRAGPNCLPRGCSVMLLIRLTIAVLQKTGGPRGQSGGNRGIKIGANRTVRAICAFRIEQDGASEGKALSSQHAGSVHAALITTGTTHEDSLCDLNFWQDRPLPRRCKELNGRKGKRAPLPR